MLVMAQITSMSRFVKPFDPKRLRVREGEHLETTVESVDVSM